MERRPGRFFLDSNVILSGLLSAGGAPRIILDVCTLALPGLIFLTGRFNLLEIERNIRKKAPAILPVYEEMPPRLHLETVPLPSADEVAGFRAVVADKDAPVLASALRGRADLLVTGDRKHFGRVRKADIAPLRIATPAEFLDELAIMLRERGPADPE